MRSVFAEFAKKHANDTSTVGLLETLPISLQLSQASVCACEEERIRVQISVPVFDPARLREMWTVTDIDASATKELGVPVSRVAALSVQRMSGNELSMTTAVYLSQCRALVHTSRHTFYFSTII
jgi:hypothetical protein